MKTSKVFRHHYSYLGKIIRISMTNYPKAYSTAVITIAFVAGIIITLGFQSIYPDLGRRYQRRRSRFPLDSHSPTRLEDRTERQSVSDPLNTVPEGIESTIGNTPLFKLKSLSEATG